jgi:hypothetical protein
MALLNKLNWFKEDVIKKVTYILMWEPGSCI